MSAAGGVDMKSLEAAGFRAGEGSDKDSGAREAAVEQRRMMLTSILTPEARERLARVGMVKPEIARAVEDHLIRLARGGKVSAKITEDNVIKILEDLESQTKAAAGVKKVTITRRKRDDEEEDDDDDF